MELDSLRERVRMPYGRENGSHHGREKEVFRDLQMAGGKGRVIGVGKAVGQCVLWFEI